MKKVTAPVGASLVVLSSFFYASYGVWTKLIGDYLGGYTVAAWRSLIVLVVMVPIAVYLKKLEKIQLKKAWPHLLGIFIASLVIWGPLYYSILKAGVGLALTVAYASIVLGTFFFGWLLAGECLTKDKLLSAVLGVGGLVLIFSPVGSSATVLALAAAALSGIGSGAVTVIAKKFPSNATQTTILMWAVGLVANVCMALLFKEAHPTVELRAEWLYIILFAVASVMATWSMIAGVKLIEAGAAGILGLLEIVFGLGFGIIFFHERPGTAALVGAVVIIAASAIPYVKDFNLKRGTLS